MATTIDDRRLHDIYRMRDLSGRLLYIGVTNGGLRRFMEHAKDKTWWREVAQIDVEHVHCSRPVIESIEREAIRSEHPLYNVAHNEARNTQRVTRESMIDAANAIASVIYDDHYCDSAGSGCPTSAVLLDKLRSAYNELSPMSNKWVSRILSPGHTAGTRYTHNVQGAAQTALVTLIATEWEDDTCEQMIDEWGGRRLKNIMFGGWGAPVEAFHQVSAMDCVTILRTYFDPIMVQSIGFAPGVEICELALQQAAT